jgi:hypothetical protein
MSTQLAYGQATPVFHTVTPETIAVVPNKRHDYFSSSEHLQKLLADPQQYRQPPTGGGPLRTSPSELRQLIKDPYYVRGKSRETLFDSRPMSPPHTHFVPSMRSGTMPLSTENLHRWDDMNVRENMLNKYMQPPIDNSVYERRATAAPDDDTFSRGSRRTSGKYKAKIDRARRDFISAPPANHSDRSMEEKFRVSLDDIRRPVQPARGPLLDKFHDKTWHSKIDLTQLPPSSLYGHIPANADDREYDALRANAERQWAAYMRRQEHRRGLYTQPRSYSANYLETDVDTGVPGRVSGQYQIQQTDLDYVHSHSKQVCVSVVIGQFK